MITVRLSEMLTGAGGNGQEKMVVAAGLVMGIRTINTRRGRMAIVTLDDRTARLDVTLFADIFDENRSMINKDKVLVVKGKLSLDDYTGSFRLTAENVFNMDTAREYYARRLVINIDQNKGRNGFVQSLVDVLSPYKEGRCPIWVEYKGADASVKLPLGSEWKVHPTDELIHRLGKLADEGNVRMEYVS